MAGLPRAPRLPGRSDKTMAFPEACDFVRSHDRPFRGVAAGPGRGICRRQPGRAAESWIPGRQRQVSFPSAGRRRRGDGLHTGAGPGDAVRVDAGGVRPGLRLLRHRANGAQAQPHPGGDRGPGPGGAAPLPGGYANLESGLHGHGRTVGQLRRHPRGAGGHHRRPQRHGHFASQDHRFYRGPVAADAPAHGGDPGQSGHFAAFGAGRGAVRADAGQPEVLGRSVARMLPLPAGAAAEAHHLRVPADQRLERSRRGCGGARGEASRHPLQGEPDSLQPPRGKRLPPADGSCHRAVRGDPARPGHSGQRAAPRGDDIQAACGQLYHAVDSMRDPVAGSLPTPSPSGRGLG